MDVFGVASLENMGKDLGSFRRKNGRQLITGPT
jgi:hypothetical protein